MRYTPCSSASLGEFGKHKPPVSSQQAPATSPGASFDPSVLGGSAGPKVPSSEDHLENVFGEEMAAQVGRLTMGCSALDSLVLRDLKKKFVEVHC